MTFAILALAAALIGGGRQADPLPQDPAAAGAVDPPVKHEITLAADAPPVELRAAWDNIADSTYKLHEKHPQLQDFKPAETSRSYGPDAFVPFLPPRPVAVGDRWPVDVEAAVALLRQFHPGATSMLHHMGQPGAAVACLRAIGPTHAEIMLRVHAEFVLEWTGQPRSASSWLTPAQFEGRLVIDLRRNAVESFHLYLPPINTNVDVNVPAGEKMPGAVLADIGYIPRMELRSPAPNDAGEFANIEYGEQIDDADARLRLQRAFYAFAAVDWMSIPDALKRSQTEGIPMHLIILFGALQDESC